MRTMACVFALMLVSSAAAQETKVPDAPAVEQRDFRDVWPGYVVVPWSAGTPPLNEHTAAAYREQGINAIHVDKEISDAEAGWIDANKFRFYVDHAAGKGTLYLNREQQDAIRGLHPATQYDAGDGLIRRPKCLRDPAALAAMDNILRKNVTADSKHDAIFYSLDDEISTGSFISPVETCWCPHCQDAFRKFALNLYGGSLDKLNAEWGTAFKSADEICPESAAGPLKQATTLTPDKWNFSRWADFHEFMDQTMADTLVREVKLANQIDPRRPVGFEGGQMPCAYGGYDFSRLARSVQWIENYDMGGNDAITRSLAPNVVRVKTFFASGDPLRDVNYLWYHFVQGDRGVILWPQVNADSNAPSKKTVPWWNEKAELRKDLAHLPPVFRELTGKRMSTLLAGAELIDDGIALYYSQPSVRAQWIMDATAHGSTWPNRGSGIEATCSSSGLTRLAWIALLRDAGLQPTFLDAAKLAAGELKFPRYKVLILPAVLAMSDDEAAAIKKFAESGGKVIADYLPGLMDEHCRSRGAKGALDDLFSAKHDWSKGLFDRKHPTEIDGEKYNKPLGERFYIPDSNKGPQEPSVEWGLDFVHSTNHGWGEPFGKGRGLLINLSFAGYLANRFAGRAMGSRISEVGTCLLAEPNEVSPIVLVKTAGELTEVTRWRKAERIYLCVVKNPQGDFAKRGKLAERAGLSDVATDITVTVVGDKPAELVNERTGKPVDVVGVPAEKDFLARWKFSDTWVPCEAAIYSYPVGGK